MRIAAAFAVIAFFLPPATPAEADSFTILPNGSIEFNTRMSSRGIFTCLRGVPCSGSGTNSITIGSGTSTATLTFTGASASFGVGNIAKQVSLGTVQGVASEGFTFPRRGALGDRQIFRLNLTVEHTSPTVSTRGKSMMFGPGGRPDVRVLQESPGNSLVFPTGPQPAGSHYTALVYSILPWPVTIRSNGRTDITARVGAVPEPSTLLLLGSGLAYGAYARRRKRAAARSGQ
jgi:hypothetical protein